MIPLLSMSFGGILRTKRGKYFSNEAKKKKKKKPYRYYFQDLNQIKNIYIIVS